MGSENDDEHVSSNEKKGATADASIGPLIHEEDGTSDVGDELNGAEAGQQTLCGIAKTHKVQRVPHEESQETKPPPKIRWRTSMRVATPIHTVGAATPTATHAAQAIHAAATV